MPTSAPIIVHANNFQFARAQRVTSTCVHSRMLLWCKAGRGVVRIHQAPLAFAPGDVLLAPWRHRIDYQADADEPFFVAGIHVIPRQARGTPLVRAVAHKDTDLPHLARCRFDAPWPELDGLHHGHWVGDEPLPALADYIVRRFQHSPPTPEDLQTLALLLVEEMRLFFANPNPSRQGLPIDLQRAMQYIDDHLGQAVYLDQVARIANRSLSWLHRAFRTSLGITPMRYLITARMRRARALLATSTLNVGEIGQAVGIDDPYYFTKLFTQHVGTAPTHYRRQASLF